MTPKPNGTRSSGLFDTIKFPNKNKGGSLNPEYLASKGGGGIGGMGSGPKRGGALQDYLKNQKQASYTDRGVDFNYDRKTKTYSGGSREGSYSVPREVMKQLSTGTQGVSLKDYYTPKFSTVKETTMRMTNPNKPRQPMVPDPRPRNPGGLGSGMGTPIPPKPGMSNPRIPSTMVDPGPRKPMVNGPLGPRNPNGPRKPMGTPTGFRPDSSTPTGRYPGGIGFVNDSGMIPKKFPVTPGKPSTGSMPVDKKTADIAARAGKYSPTKMRDGGMTARKGYADGGMPMVMKDGKKVPSFAADGRGKMAMGGMATKNKGAAMKHGGMAHGKAPKGRGMAIMIAIGKPKGRGKS